MHDEDDPEQKAGRLYYFGVHSSADRAEYALPLGEPALQGGDPEFELGQAPNSRRRFLAIGIGLVGMGAAYAAGGVFSDGESTEAMEGRNRSNKSDPKPVDSEAVRKFVDSARAVAYGPIGDLVHSRDTFIMVFESHGENDRKLWHGIERLADYAMRDRSKVGFDIADRLLMAFKINSPPLRLRHLRFELEEFAAAFKKLHR
jgi:hypothetical protein